MLAGDDDLSPALGRDIFCFAAATELGVPCVSWVHGLCWSTGTAVCYIESGLGKRAESTLSKGPPHVLGSN
jgi:hypothetical protein